MFCSLGKCSSISSKVTKEKEIKYNEFIHMYDYSTRNLDDFINKFKREFIEISDNYLLKSYKIFFLKNVISNYIPSINFDLGLLRENSVNCKFTIANINNQSDKFFIKVVDITNHDLIIYDVINSIIFRRFNEEFMDTHGDIYETCLIKYISSFVSYYDNRGGNYYWNYNDLIYFEKKPTAKYNYNNLIRTKQKNYNKNCHIFITNAVKGKAESVGQIINTHITNKKKCFTVIASLYQVYLFLEWVGIVRGYVHNDLHLGNILFDDINDRIIIIDYGRNVFCYYYDNENEFINSCVVKAISDLNLNDNFINSSQLTYRNLIESKYFKYNIPNFSIKDISNANTPHYMGIIFDLMTLSLNLYKKLIIINVNDIISIFNNFLILTDNEIKINSRNLAEIRIGNIILFDKVIDNYFIYRQEIQLLEGEENAKLKDVYFAILDGLFFFQLLLLRFSKFSINLRNKEIVYSGGFQIAYLKKSTMITYLDFLYTHIYLPNISRFNNCLVLRLLPNIIIGGSLSKKKKQMNNHFTISKMNDYISKIKKTFNYKLDTQISIADESNSYINLYDYINSNKLSLEIDNNNSNIL